MIQLHIFTIFMSKRDIRLFPSMSIQILVNFYAPDRPSARMKCNYAIANVRDFWRCTGITHEFVSGIIGDTASDMKLAFPVTMSVKLFVVFPLLGTLLSMTVTLLVAFCMALQVTLEDASPMTSTVTFIVTLPIALPMTFDYM